MSSRITRTSPKPSKLSPAGKRLPVVKKTLETVKHNVKSMRSAGSDLEQSQALENLVKAYDSKVKQLQKTFDGLRDSEDKPVIQAYRTLVTRIGKSVRVESLMADILADLQTMGSGHVFQTATRRQMEGLERAIEDINRADPSLPNSEFEEKAGSHDHYGEGDMYQDCDLPVK